MSEPARHLRIVTEHGELLDQHPDIQRLEDEVKGLQRALRKEIHAHEELKRDKDAEARAHQLWPKAYAVFEAWKVACDHPKATWPGKAADRFWDIEPFLAKKEYGLDGCLRAVAGMAFDHFSVKRKNGTVRRFDEWSRIFKNTDEFEERANRAPKGWRDLPHFAEVLERWAP